jgi:predicted transcriptional regulator
MKMSPSDRSKKTMPVSVRLPRHINKKLGEYAATEDRSKSWLIEQAVHDFVALREWQIAAVKEGIRQADAGMGIPHEDVVKRLRSLGKTRRARKNNKKPGQ